MIRKSWARVASIEETLALWAASLPLAYARPSLLPRCKDVGARDKPGHDETPLAAISSQTLRMTSLNLSLRSNIIPLYFPSNTAVIAAWACS